MRKWFCLWGALALATAVRAGEAFDVPVAGPDAEDPLILQGEYTPPATPGRPVLICAHGLGSTGAEWAPLVAAARKRGWGAYIFDARGHGRSRRTLSGRSVDHDRRPYRSDPRFWAMMIDDLARVAEALGRQKSVTAGQRVLVGASLGANVCLRAAQAVPSAGIVALSPGREYAGIDAEEAMPTLAAPALLVSAQPDVYAHASAERLLGLAARPGFVKWIGLENGTPAGAHGTQLFDGKIEGRLLDWVGAVTGAVQKTRGAPTPKR